MNLNGYTLKAVKMMETPRGISYSGSIFYSGKNIGTAYNGGDGGMTHIHLSPDYQNHYAVLDEDFVERLFTLNDYETMFKAETKDKQGQGMAFATYANPFDLKYFFCTQDELMKEIVSRIQKPKPNQEVESIELFRTLHDFDITPSNKSQSQDKLMALYVELSDKDTKFKDMSDWDMAKDYNGAERFSDGSRPLIAETKFADIVISGTLDNDKVIIGIHPYGEMCDYFYEGYTTTKELAEQIGKEIEEYVNANEDGQFMFSNGSFREFFRNLNITNIRTHDFKDETLPNPSENYGVLEPKTEADQGAEM